MFFLPFHLFTNFNLFSKVQRPILSWPIMSLKVFPVIPCAPSSPPPIRSHQITCWSPKLSLLFLNSVLLKSSFPSFSKCFLPLSSSSASIRPDSAYSGMLFLIPKHRIRGSNIPLANTIRCVHLIWMLVILECGYLGPSLPTFVSLVPGTVPGTEWALTEECGI